MNIISILVKRNGITEAEAREKVMNCQDEIDDVLNMGGGYDQIADIIESWLGLEMDYLFDVLEGI